MKNLLIATLGNRDLQIHSKNLQLISNEIIAHFEKNSENPDYYVISKKNENGYSFLKRTELLLNQDREIYNFFDYPIIKKAEEIAGVTFDKYILVGTRQVPPFHLDTFFAGEIICNILTDKELSVDMVTIYNNPNDLNTNYSFFTDLYEKYNNEFRIYLTNSGGTPSMRTGTHLAGLFRSIEFLTFAGSGREELINNDIESFVVRNMIRSQLETFNFEGVKKIPGISTYISNLCDYAISRMNLDYENARKYSKDLPDFTLLPENISTLIYQKDLILTARIKTLSGAWGDYLWRLFSFKDNFLVDTVKKLLNGDFDPSDKKGHIEWNDLIINNPDLKRYLENITLDNGSQLNFSYPNEITYYYIYNFYSDKDSDETVLVSKLHYTLKRLSDLRNKIAHDLHAINKKMIHDKISKKELGITNRDDRIETFFKLLFEFCGEDNLSFGVYDIVKNEILAADYK